jgi:hypothetical protein
MPKFVRQGDNTLIGNNTFTGTNTFSGSTVLGAVTATSMTVSGLSTANTVYSKTITDIDAQNGTPTAAQLLGGVIVHTSVTGAGTLTVPTGTLMSGAISGVAVGTTIKWLYYNDGNQTVTITANTDHTLVGGTAAVTTGKHMEIISVCTAANTWKSFLTTLM